MDKYITKADLISFLGVSYQTFHSWLKNGLLGEKYIDPGRGKVRKFYLEDVVIARVLQETMEMTRSFQFVEKVITDFINNEKQEDIFYLVITKNENTSSARESQIYYWIYRDIDINEYLENYKKSVTFIPISKIFEEARSLFSQL